MHIAQHPFSLPPIPRAEFKAVIEGPVTRAREAGRKLMVDSALTEASCMTLKALIACRCAPSPRSGCTWNTPAAVVYAGKTMKR